VNKLLGEKCLEIPDNFFDSIIDERKCIHYRASLNPRITFPELYRESKIRIHLHLLGIGNGQFGDYCAIFGYYPIPDFSPCKTITQIETIFSSNAGAIFKNDPSQITRTIEDETVQVTNGTNQQDISVFVTVIDTPEYSESIPTFPLPSLVRLAPLNQCPVFGIDASKVSIFTIGILTRAIRDREIQMPTSVIRRRQLTELVNQEIKSGASIVGEITDNTTPLDGGRMIDFSLQSIIRWLRVGLEREGIGVRLLKPVDFELEGIEMLLCPSEFQF